MAALANRPLKDAPRPVASALARRPKPCHYSRDGNLGINSDGAENAIRPIAVGCRHYWRNDSHQALPYATVAYSLLLSWRRPNIDTSTRHTDVLRRPATQAHLRIAAAPVKSAA